MADADPQKTFNVHDAKTNLSKLMERAHAGEEIILAKAGVPYAKMVPYSEGADAPRKPGRFAHLLKSVSEEAVMAPCFSNDELDAIEDASLFPTER